MRTQIAAAACAALLGLGACGGPDDDPGSPGAESTVTTADQGGDQDSDQDSDQNDAPVPADEQGSASVPGLPIGGSYTFDAAGTTTCGTLAWNSGESLPDDVVVRVTGVSNAPGVSVADDQSCGGTPCTESAFTNEQRECTLALAWDGTPPEGDFFEADMDGEASCATQEVCDEVAGAFSLGSSVAIGVPAEETGDETGDEES